MITDIVKKLPALKIQEKRSLTDDYAEFVILTGELNQWAAALTKILDSPIKPEGMEADKEALRLTKKFGGICTNQTLFKKDFEKKTVIAMFWPWGNGEQTTLKLAVV